MLFNYCDIRFFEDFFRKKPMDLEIMTSDAKNWRSFYEYGLNKKHSFIIINLSKEEALAQLQTNPIVKKLFDLYNNSQIDLKFDKNIAEKLKTVDFCKTCNPHSVFFLDNTDAESDKLEKQTGLLFFNLGNHLKKWGKYSPDSYTSPISVGEKGILKNWNYLANLRHSFNSIIIADRYLFKGDYQENLKQLFTNFLHDLEQPTIMDITILLEEKQLSYNLSMADIAKFLQKQVFNKIVNLAINLSIIQVKHIPVTHDRRIITNYFYLYSGDSFSYVTDKEPNKIYSNTDLHIYTLFDNQTMQNAKERLAEYRNLVLGAKHINLFIGTKQNRLLS